MRLHVDVREGDWADVTYGPYGASFSQALEQMVGAGDFDAAVGPQRWLDLDRRTRRTTFEIDTTSGMPVGHLKTRCLAEARRIGAAQPEPAPEPEGRGRGEYWGADRIADVWLSCPATDERISDELTVAQAELTDGDLLVLCIEHEPDGDYMMASPPNPAKLFEWLELAENSAAPAASPRLWGVLLYTDADAELAAYVRTNFDDLNVLSGPATRVFVVERRANWAQAKKYWRTHLEPELYRVMSTMHWLRWTPYDPQGAYEIASVLGVGPELLPCLVFFHSPQGPIHQGEKIVFRIEQTSTAYFRSLFGGINRALDSVATVVQEQSADANRRRLEQEGPISDSALYERLARKRETAGYAPAPEVIQSLLAPDRTSDAAAFAAVRTAEEAIRASLRPTIYSNSGISVNGSQVVVISGSGEGQVTENFYFQGEKTTFINRPQDTVIQDFQNTYASAACSDDLAQLLQLVLSSRDVSGPDREEAAGAVHELARLGTGNQPDLPTARTRIERLRALLATSADIGQPALAILASLTAFFAG